MAHTPHVLLVGPGAEEFARSQQVPLVDPDYFLSTWGDGDSSQLGTVGCVARDKRGNLAAGTSTGGTAKKLPGRVGDSPIVGAGTYAANDSCAVSGTGIGEEFIRHAVAHDIAAQMRYAGRTLESAVWTVIGERLPAGIGGVIAVSHLGEIVMQHNTPGLSCGAADSSGRFEIHLALDRGGAPAAGPVSAEHQIQSLLEQQARDWNDGKLDAFMSVYWNSDQLTFSSGGTITRGFDATLARYRQRYPTAEAMGRVGFSELEFLPLGGDAIQVLGRWQLSRAEDAIAGRFTLVWQRFASGWKIVHDHTSLDDK
jgi:beta-aspartyl-peptidase (threonine type)